MRCSGTFWCLKAHRIAPKGTQSRVFSKSTKTKEKLFVPVCMQLMQSSLVCAFQIRGYKIPQLFTYVFFSSKTGTGASQSEKLRKKCTDVHMNAKWFMWAHGRDHCGSRANTDYDSCQSITNFKQPKVEQGLLVKVGVSSYSIVTLTHWTCQHCGFTSTETVVIKTL